MLFSHGPNIAFLVPDSYRARERNGIITGATDDAIENLKKNVIFRQLDFFILQDKDNVRTLSLNIKLICTRCKTG